MAKLSALQWEQVEELFAAAQDLPEAERERFVLAAGAGGVVEAEVLSLLGVAEVPIDVQGAIGQVAAILCEETEGEGTRAGQLIGQYRVDSLIGRGGMGSVYLAHREGKEFSQRVAIKVLTAGMQSTLTLERFRQERQILARLEHPNIARLLDGGETSDGQPYLAMEYIDGKLLNEYCRDRSVRAPLKLFLRLSEAVAYAHRQLVGHRDLKPGNILVTADGEPKLLDFGVAKLLEDGELQEGLTQAFPGVQMLTPEYASPEQIRNETVGTGADVYALGAILYELLSGVKAHDFPDLTPASVRQVVCEFPVTKPSAAVQRREPGDVRLRRTLSGDLDNIVLKALNKDRHRRYDTAADLADDIERYLNGYPVHARPDSWSYRMQKFVGRNRMAVAAGVLAGISAVIGVVLVVREKQQAERRFQQVRGLANQFLVDVDKEMRSTPGTTRAREVMVRTALVSLDGLAKEARGDVGILSDLADAYEKAAQVQGVPGYQNLGQVDEALASQRKSVELFRQSYETNRGDAVLRRRYSDQLSNYGRVLMLEGNLRAARPVLEEGIRLLQGAKSLEEVTVVSYSITHLGRVLTLEGEHEASEALLRKGVALLQPFGDRARAARYQVESDLAEELRLNGYAEKSEAIQIPVLKVRRENQRLQIRDTIRMRRLGQALHAAGVLYAGGLEPGFDRPHEAAGLLEESRVMFARMRDADVNNLSGPVELAIANMELARILPPERRALELAEESIHLLESVPVKSALMPGYKRRALALHAAPLRALGKTAEAEAFLVRAGRPTEEWLAHLIAGRRWKEAVEIGEAALTANGDLSADLRQSWIRKQLQLAYVQLGMADRAAASREWRRKTWEAWVAKRPGNAQILAELRAVDGQP